MSLIELKIQLELLGCTIKNYPGKNEFLVGGEGDTDTDLRIKTLTNVFTVRCEKDKVTIGYLYYQIPKKQRFTSIDDFMSFVKIKFPL